jgi:hypothetical protein
MFAGKNWDNTAQVSCKEVITCKPAGTAQSASRTHLQAIQYLRFGDARFASIHLLRR